MGPSTSASFRPWRSRSTKFAVLPPRPMYVIKTVTSEQLRPSGKLNHFGRRERSAKSKLDSAQPLIGLHAVHRSATVNPHFIRAETFIAVRARVIFPAACHNRFDSIHMTCTHHAGAALL